MKHETVSTAVCQISTNTMASTPEGMALVHSEIYVMPCDRILKPMANICQRRGKKCFYPGPSVLKLGTFVDIQA